MADFKSTFERLELKYLIDESQVERIREAIRPWCKPDSYGFGAGELGYVIESLYLDTPSLMCFRDWEASAPHRFKLRARTYGDDGPVNLEVKEKHRDVIRKTRVAIPRSDFHEATSGFARPKVDSPWHRRQVERFASLAQQTGAEPKLLVRYFREAYGSHADGYARVTFDRKIEAQIMEDWDSTGHPDHWISVDGAWNIDGIHSPVILELKCERQMPGWMASLIQSLSLVRQGFSKFAGGIRTTELASRGLDIPSGMRMIG